MGNLAAWSHGAAVVYSSHSFDADATLKAVQKVSQRSGDMK